MSLPMGAKPERLRATFALVRSLALMKIMIRNLDENLVQTYSMNTKVPRLEMKEID